MDRESFRWATQLAETTIALEVGPFGMIALAERAISVAIVGAERPILVDGRLVDGQGVVRLKEGQSLELGFPSKGARSYLALAGMKPPEGAWLGSISGVAVARGVAILGHGTLPLRHVVESIASLEGPLLVLPGPQAELLPALLAERWEASKVMDRTGVRLDGSPIPIPDLGNLTSEPQVVGTIQLTSGGTPIIIGPDGPTIGGYAKPGILASSSFDRMGQLKPGDSVELYGPDS